MPSRRSIFAKLSVPLAAWVLLIGPAAVYYYFYTQSQKAYFAARNFRQLSVMSEQLRFTLSNYSTILENATTKADSKTYLSQFVRELKPVPTALAASGSGFSLEPLVREGTWHIRLAFASDGTSIRADRDVADMVDRFPGADIFDAVLLASDSGTVLYQGGTNGLRFTSLDGLGLAKDVKWNAASRLFSDVDLSGERFHVFVQPVPINGASQWTLCGLVRSQRFLTESLAISYDVIICFVAVSILILLSLPLVRLRSLTGWESLRLRDLIAIFVCTCSAAGVVVLLGLHLYHFEVQERRALPLDAMAARIHDELTSELQNISRQLQAFCRQPQFWSDLEAHAGDRTQPGWKPGAAPPPNQQKFRPFLKPEAYPSLKFAVWADESGWQWIKWDVRSSVTPFINIHERIAALKTLHAWELPEAEGERFLPFRLELVYSQNTGEYIANYVVRTADCVPPDQRAQHSGDPLIASGFAYIATELQATLDPLLPPDTGFAVVDEKGKTVIHSEAVRNRWENFFQESDDDQTLRAAVYTRSTSPLHIRYQGRSHSAFVRPLQGLPYSVVVFRDNTPLNTLHLQTQTLSGGLLFAYLALMAIAGSIALKLGSPHYPAAWVWPDRELCALYRANAALNGLLLLLMGLWILFGRPSQLYVAVIAIGSFAFFSNIWILVKREPCSYRGRPLIIAILAVALMSIAFFAGSLYMLLLPAGVAAALFVASSQTVLQWAGRKTKWCPQAYAISATMLLTLIGVAPAFACFRIAHNFELELLVRSAQIDIAKKVAARVAAAEKAHGDNQNARLAAVKRGEEVALLDPFDPAKATPIAYTPYFFGTQLNFSAKRPEQTRPAAPRPFQRLLAGLRIAFNQHVARSSGIPLSRASSEWSWTSAGWPLLQYQTQDRSGPAARYPLLVETEFRDVIHLVSLVGLSSTGPTLLVWIAFGFTGLLCIFVCMRFFANYVAMPDIAGVAATPHAMATAAAAHSVAAVVGRSSPAKDCDSAAAADLIDRECGSDRTLRQLAAGSDSLQEASRSSRSTLFYELLEKFSCHYQSIWAGLSSQERFVLYHLAQDGIVNPRNQEALYKLIRSGLIVSKPRFEIFNESFRLYILGHVDPSELRKWELVKAETRGISMRLLMAIVVAAVIGFLFFTQPDLLQTSVGLLTAAAAAIGALLRLLPALGGQAEVDVDR